MEKVTINPKDYTILVVDDNLTNLKVVVNYLREFGFKLLMVKSGQACLDTVQTRLPDIILLDVMMPEIDGFETCRRLKAAKSTQDIPIIFMTALATEEDKVKGFEVGAVDYVTKPIQQREVLARVMTHLRLIALLREQEHQRKISESLRKVSRILNSTLNQKQLLHVIMEQLRQVVPFDGGAIFLQEDTQLILSQAMGFGETYIGQMLPLTDNSSVVRVFQFQKPMLITDTQQDERWQKWHEADRIASWMGVPLVIENEVMGVITVDSFTAQKYTEVDLSILQIFANHATVAIRNARLYSLVQGVNEQLAKSNADKDKFFSIVAHDLKGPFLPLLGNLELMAEMRENLTLQDMYDMSKASHRSARRVYELLDNLLHWALLQMGRMEYCPKRLDVFNVVAKNSELLLDSAKMKQINLLNQVSDRTWVSADENMLDTVIRNLINNALKFTSPGGQVAITTRFGSELDLEQQLELQTPMASFVEVSIADTGVGMREEVQQKLFRLDQNVTTVGTNKEMGTGLGLIICQEMVVKNGGRIWVESEVGQGTTVRFTVPVSQ